MTEKDHFGHFREVGVVFDVFIPTRGFGFVRYKTEWDARRAINLLNGRLIGGKKISVQMAKYEGRQEKH